jgi:pSer/pThr/pTyr-binding forkhead associated (FHA) protein
LSSKTTRESARVVPLSRDEYTLGRREGNTIRLTERNISRDHAKVRRKPGAKETYVLEDAQSYNGVHVNGLRVAEPIELQHGDLIQVGDYRIVFQDDSMTEATAPYVPVSEVEATKKTLPMANAFRGSLLMERPTRLVMLVGPTPGVEFPIETELTTVGRSEECTVSIDHNSVSRVHCEIHALGEGRYEIVDKGSSNGVRVNGADLRRGIIEAGDLIELGDVRFKFVGAGQVFIPGANESQQLTAISDRQVELADRRPKPAKGSVVPYMMLGAVVAALLVGGGYYALARNGNGPPAGGTTGDAIVDYEKGKLDEAVAVCAKGGDPPRVRRSLRERARADPRGLADPHLDRLPHVRGQVGRGAHPARAGHGRRRREERAPPARRGHDVARRGDPREGHGAHRARALEPGLGPRADRSRHGPEPAHRLGARARDPRGSTRRSPCSGACWPGVPRATSAATTAFTRSCVSWRLYASGGRARRRGPRPRRAGTRGGP